MGISGAAQGVESGKDLILIKTKTKTSTKKILQTNYWVTLNYWILVV